MNEIIKSEFFPFYDKSSANRVNQKSANCKSHTKCANLKNRILLGIGANLSRNSANPPMRSLTFLFLKLRSHPKIRIISTSPIFKNPPFGFTHQNDFYNATIWLFSGLCLMEFYRLIFYLERIFGRGRIRAFKNAPRTLDIDILAFNRLKLRTARLNLPHAHWQNRASVLVPLVYQINYKGQ